MAYRKIDTNIWDDKIFEKLTPMERYLFLYFWTNSLCNQAGLYEITLRKIEFHTKIPSRDLEPLLKGIPTMVHFSPENEVVWVKNFLKWQCQNKQFAESALKIVEDRYPNYLQVFVNKNKCLFKKYKISVPETPENYLEPPLNPPPTSTEQNRTEQKQNRNRGQISGEKKSNVLDRFETFWASYPKKKSKGQAEKTFYKLNPDEQLLEKILESLTRAKTQDSWVKNNGQFIPHPSTWLNAKGWEDDLDVEITPPPNQSLLTEEKLKELTS